MNNITSILILIFLAITFLQSGYDKLFYWKDNVEWLKGHFSKTPLKNQVPLALANILVLELICRLYRIISKQRKNIWILRSCFFLYHIINVAIRTAIS